MRELVTAAQHYSRTFNLPRSPNGLRESTGLVDAFGDPIVPADAEIMALTSDDAWAGLEDEAAGFGWFIDPTPDDDAEFDRRIAADLLQSTSDEAEQHMDLLSAVMHELGHQLGLEDEYDPHTTASLMSHRLFAGTRRLPRRSR